MPYTIHHGDALDALDALRGIPDASVDAVVTDPPYGLGDQPAAAVRECLRRWMAGDRFDAGGGGFMGKAWDAWVPDPAIWSECYRVLKPGGHLLLFAAARTVDLLGIAVRLGVPDGAAGWVPRPAFAWLYGQGAGLSHVWTPPTDEQRGRNADLSAEDDAMVAAGWEGWARGWAKPAYEPVLAFQKPTDGPTWSSVLAHGVGGVNVDGCRVATGEVGGRPLISVAGPTVAPDVSGHLYGSRANGSRATGTTSTGRFPPTVLLSHLPGCERDDTDTVDDWRCTPGCPAAAVGAQSGQTTSTDRPRHNTAEAHNRSPDYGAASPGGWTSGGHTDTGTAARFFPQFDHAAESVDPFLYNGKASTAEREAGCAGNGRVNCHPTVKPIAVMRWLVRFVCPPGGALLDPFAGAGTTLIAGMLEGVGEAIGCELLPRPDHPDDEDHAGIARMRCAWWAEHGERAIDAWKARKVAEERDAKTGQMGLFSM